MKENTVLFWFEEDLRIADNKALIEAANHGAVLPIYILDEGSSWWERQGATSKLWLHQSLDKLNQSLDDNLLVFQGSPHEIIPKICQETNISHIYWNERIPPYRRRRDEKLISLLKEKGLHSHISSSFLWDPHSFLTVQGTPYKVFSAYYNKCLSLPAPTAPLSKPTLKFPSFASAPSGVLSLKQLQLLPMEPWAHTLIQQWHPGESAAHQRLHEFITTDLPSYAQNRDHPHIKKTSYLSPYFSMGSISLRSVWHAVTHASIDDKDSQGKESVQKFISELIWNCFSHYLLYHFPNLPEENFSSNLDVFPWVNDSQQLNQWQQGLTGIPFVDAGMRQLWRTGYMHNRVRMITASFLTKNLRTDWRHGAKWFWDCLVDANLANNTVSWQWVAGCGVDASPFFRVFNPVTQAKTFDPAGGYIRRFIPELSSLPVPYLFAPWTAPQDILEDAGIILGETYPYPMVDLSTSRHEALAGYKLEK